MKRTSARIDMVATAIDAIHHGAGISGNVSLLRTQAIITPEGLEEEVPFISGNSFKHMIREAGARYALAAMGVEDGTLTKPVVDLLFSGGSLSKAGAAVDLERARQLEGLFPLLSLCGYSAGNVMVPGKLYVDNLHLACEENAWRMPQEVAALPPAQKPAGYLRGDGFGTRHESSRRPHVARLLTDAENKRLAERAADNALVQHGNKGDSAQMIYEYEVIKPGAVLWGALHLDELTEMEYAALRSALTTACEGVGPDGGLLFRVGAKASIGCGRVSIRFKGWVREPVAPAYSESTDLARIAPEPTADLDPYITHLRENKDAILRALEEAFA
jgi:hypothetical protein